jgi:hypothetical protein
MNEQELRDGLRDVVVASSPPPPMNPNTALDAAHRAQRKRRTAWAGAGAGLAVVAVATGVMFALGGGGRPAELPVAAPATPTDTKPSWPDGQPDRTARSGPQAQKGADLQHAVIAALPATLTVDPDLKYPGSDDLVTAPQAQFRDRDKGTDVWEYESIVAVKTASKSGTGRVIVQVVTPGNSEPTDVCALAKNFWSVSGTCQVRDVQGKKVGVVSQTKDARIDQTAAYRYDDGTIVYAAQSRSPDNDGQPNGQLAQPPLTLDQLAALPLNAAFKIS